MDAEDFAFALRFYIQSVVGRGFNAPAGVVGDFGHDVVGQLHGGAAGLVQFVDVVCLGQRKLVAISLGQSGKLLVEQKHDIHPDAEIGCGEQALLLSQTALLDFLVMFLPGSGAHHDGQVQVEAAVDVADHLVGLTEFDGDVGLFQQAEAFFPFLGVVDGDDDFMMTGKGGF